MMKYSTEQNPAGPQLCKEPGTLLAPQRLEVLEASRDHPWYGQYFLMIHRVAKQIQEPKKPEKKKICSVVIATDSLVYKYFLKIPRNNRGTFGEDTEVQVLLSWDTFSHHRTVSKTNNAEESFSNLERNIYIQTNTTAITLVIYVVGQLPAEGVIHLNKHFHGVTFISEQKFWFCSQPPL